MSSHRIENRLCIIDAPATLALNAPSKFKGYVLPLLERAEVEGIVINCRELQSLDSYGIGVIVSLLKSAKEAGKKFALTDLNEQQRKLFQVTKLDSVIDIFDSEKAALSALGR